MSSKLDILEQLLSAVHKDDPLPRWLLVRAACEIEQLRFAIRRLAEQDATLSVCEGDVTVTMDAALTDAERYAVTAGLRALSRAMYADPENLGGEYRDMQRDAATLRGLLERLK